MSSSSFSLQPFHNAANIIVVRPPVKLAIDLPAFSRDHLVERVADYLCRVLHFCIGWLVSLDECPAASFHLTKISKVFFNQFRAGGFAVRAEHSLRLQCYETFQRSEHKWHGRGVFYDRKGHLCGVERQKQAQLRNPRGNMIEVMTGSRYELN